MLPQKLIIWVPPVMRQIFANALRLSSNLNLYTVSYVKTYVLQAKS